MRKTVVKRLRAEAEALDTKSNLTVTADGGRFWTGIMRHYKDLKKNYKPPVKTRG